MYNPIEKKKKKLQEWYGIQGIALYNNVFKLVQHSKLSEPCFNKARNWARPVKTCSDQNIWKNNYTVSPWKSLVSPISPIAIQWAHVLYARGSGKIKLFVLRSLFLWPKSDPLIRTLLPLSFKRRRSLWNRSKLRKKSCLGSKEINTERETSRTKIKQLISHQFCSLGKTLTRFSIIYCLWTSIHNEGHSRQTSS